MTTRERLIDTTARIIQEKGLAAVTTKEVAERADVAEATIYRHFADKTDLVLTALTERLPKQYPQLISTLPQRAGTATVAANLEELITAALDFFAQTVIFSAAVAANPELTERHNARMQAMGQGPEKSREAVTAYLLAEQRLGRIRADANVTAAALILLNVPYSYAMVRHMSGASALALPQDRFAHEIVQTLLTGIMPPTNT
jgi:AcrR family transcriptional regulator